MELELKSQPDMGLEPNLWLKMGPEPKLQPSIEPETKMWMARWPGSKSQLDMGLELK